ncbi:hypothetical protein [Streptomyces sp. NPDC020965]|uniref:hypothetical protein n=1 Tax=Streptomyces sp. NPDC020965 TaxID=3365105 RepID=UPI00378F539A
MDSYGTAQLPGDRDHQCDATAVWTAPSRARAYVLLDGVGDTPTVRAWTRTAARRLARTAALHANPEAGLRTERARYAAEPGRHCDHGPQLPCAAAVVVHTPAAGGTGGMLTFAWSGDARAYLLFDGHLRLITEDHNQRRAYNGYGDRNVLTACLGDGWDDQETEERFGHPAVESVHGPARPGRLLLTSDGAYEVVHHRATSSSGRRPGRRLLQVPTAVRPSPSSKPGSGRGCSTKRNSDVSWARRTDTRHLTQPETHQVRQPPYLNSSEAGHLTHDSWFAVTPRPVRPLAVLAPDPGRCRFASSRREASKRSGEASPIRSRP